MRYLLMLAAIIFILCTTGCKYEDQLTDPVFDKAEDIAQNVMENFIVNGSVLVVLQTPDGGQCFCDLILGADGRSMALRDCQYQYTVEDRFYTDVCLMFLPDTYRVAESENGTLIIGMEPDHD